MYIVNGVAYAGSRGADVRVAEVKPLADMMLLITFMTGETRLYDASALLEYPAFGRLREQEIFMNPVVEFGVVTWADGEIDIAPETMYHDSYAYERRVL